jgi:8-oxo-dGTP pyrophosphatase MutT (NUDIX family)
MHNIVQILMLSLKRTCPAGKSITMDTCDSMPTIDEIENLLNVSRPLSTPRGHRIPTAVALILRNSPTGMDILFIERARHERDPWSGNLGFPGGKVEKHDEDARRAAERETLEEIGLDLGNVRCLGRLSDITGAHVPVLISCFVYGLDKPEILTLSAEVNSIFWVPLGHLLDPEHHQTARVRFSGKTLDTPAILIPGQGDTPLWGITYRLVMQLLALLGHDLSAPVSPPVTAPFPASDNLSARRGS